MPIPVVDVVYRELRSTCRSLFELASLRAPAIWSALHHAGAPSAALRAARQHVPVPSVAAIEVLMFLGEAPGAESIGAQLVKAGGSDLVRDVRRRPLPAGAFSANLTNLVPFFESWRQEKRVYRLTPELRDALQTAPWPAAVPTSFLLPPTSAIALEIPSREAGAPPQTILVYLDLSWFGPTRTTLTLWVMELLPNPTSPDAPRMRPIGLIDLDGDTLDAAFHRTRDRFQEQASASLKHLQAIATFDANRAKTVLAEVLPTADRKRELTLVINTLLYLANCDDIVAEVATVQPWRAPQPSCAVTRGRASRSAPRNPKQERWTDLAPAGMLAVGVRYAQSVVRYERDQAEAGVAGCGSADGTPRSVRPHLRAPHLHLYWTGKGRRIPKVLFVPQTYVGGGIRGDEEAPVPVVRRVR